MPPTTDLRAEHLDAEACYRAVSSRDRRFDGVFYTAVRTTGIYCRPSCPARTPHRATCRSTALPRPPRRPGFRACKRCLPDATPGSPEWDVSADAAGRAMRLIADGVVEREGVEGLAGRLGYSSRHLTRLLTQELGAGPLALARAQRAQNARVLIETSGLAARRRGVRRRLRERPSVQRHDPRGVLRDAVGAPQLHLRRTRARGGTPAGSGVIDVRLPVRAPFDARSLEIFLARHLVPGVEDAGDGWFARSLRLPHGPGHRPARPGWSRGARHRARGRVPAAPHRHARPRAGRRALPPPHRRGLRPGRCRRSTSPTTRCWRPSCSSGRAPCPRPCRRRRAGGAHGARPAGLARRGEPPRPAWSPPRG